MLDDFGNELEEIKREIVESRSLSIKTNNLINALSADVNSIAKRQQNYERRLRWNSAAAYVATVVVMLLTGKVLVDARVETVRAHTKDQRDSLARLQKEVARLKTQDETQARDQRKTVEFYQLVRDRKHSEIVSGFKDVANLNLTPAEKQIFTQAHERSRNALSLSDYHEGLDHVRTGRWHEAEQALRQSLKYKANASHSPHARYQLARALKTLGKPKDSIALLLKLSEASTDKDIMDDATLLLAEAQVDIQAYNDAKATLRSFIRRFPNSAFINSARSRLAKLQLTH